VRHVSFLQLGDVHYPDLLTVKTADHKDKGISSALAEAVGPSRIAAITRGISQVRADEKNLVAIVLNGDLTTRGDVGGYEACLTFLHGALELSDQEYWKERRLLAVPGNHDINRSAIVMGEPLRKKFAPLLDLWVKVFGASTPLTVDLPVPVDLPTKNPLNSSPSVRFLPLNTCLLCGEYRAFPTQIRDKVVGLLNDLKRAIPADEFEKLLSEQIDCPAVGRDDVSALEQHISGNTDSSIAVVIGHHPLVAQPMPRIDGYNELLNAGFVRESVLETRRNVLYLHGHIHQDPLLLVTSPLRGPHRIIHISAPALEDGFNLIRIQFSTVTNEPLGMELIPYRFGDHLGLIRRDSIKVRLVEQGALWNEIDHPWIKYLLDELNSPQTVKRFRDLTKAPPPSLVGPGVNVAEEVENALLVLETLEMVVISNRENAAVRWLCQRKSV
jgi:3',5'-cyclic AMP phosphodiesterase CpdA